jgi:hypothetical protein
MDLALVIIALAGIAWSVWVEEGFIARPESRESAPNDSHHEGALWRYQMRYALEQRLRPYAQASAFVGIALSFLVYALFGALGGEYSLAATMLACISLRCFIPRWWRIKLS